jgi:hypothetical protein
MMDQHDRFAAWLADGAVGSPPRDLALHASGCSECLRLATALDDLGSIDAGALTVPVAAELFVPEGDRGAMIAGRAGLVAVIGLLGLFAILAIGTLFNRDYGPFFSGGPDPSIAEGVLGDGGPPRVGSTASAAASGAPSATTAPSSSGIGGSASDPPPNGSAPVGGFFGSPAPSGFGGTPPESTPGPTPGTVVPPAGTPRPSVPPVVSTPRPTPAPTSVPTVPPTPAVTPPPTPAPTPTPTPTPTPVADSDGDGIPDSSDNCPTLWDPTNLCVLEPIVP